MPDPFDEQSPSAHAGEGGLPMAGLLADLLADWEEPSVQAAEAPAEAPSEAPAQETVEGAPALVDSSADQAEPEAAPAPVPAAAPALEFKIRRRVDASLIELIQKMHARSYGDARARDNQKRTEVAHLVFHLCGKRYAVPLEQIQLVDRIPALIALPGLSAPVAGLANVRGDVIPVVDLRRWWPGGGAPAQSQGRMIVVRPRDPAWTTALIVDTLGGLVWLASGPLESTDHPLLAGLAHHEGEPLAIVHLDRLLAAIEHSATVH